jgi:DNA-binding helix-hairpin-helix protein with protein kinase domain
MTIDYYAGPPRDTLLASRRLVWPEQPALIEQALRSGQPVFLMESHEDTRAVRWLYPPAQRRQHYEHHALMPRVRRTFGVEATPYFRARGGPMFYRLSRP